MKMTSVTARIALLVIASQVVVPSTEAQFGGLPGPGCKKSLGSATIAFIDAQLTTSVLTPERRQGKPVASIHFDVRNSGSLLLSRMCFTASFLNGNNSRQDARVIIRNPAKPDGVNDKGIDGPCFAPDLSPGGIIHVDLQLEPAGEADSLPLTGTIIVGASAKTTEDTGPGATANGSVCYVDAAPLIRPTVLRVPAYSCASLVPLFLFLLIVLFTLIAIIVLWKHLKQPMGGPQWSFTSSYATNLTFGTTVLNLILTSALVPENPHFMLKQTYMAFSILFLAVVAIPAPLFLFFSRPGKITATDGSVSVGYTGSVGVFLISAALYAFAALSQLAVAAILFAEFVYQHYLALSNAVILYLAMAGVAVGLLFYTVRTARFYIGLHIPAKRPADTTEETRVELAPQIVPVPWKVF